MAILLFLILTCLQIYIGFWAISYFNRKTDSFTNRLEHIFLSLIIGMGISSVFVLVLDIFFIPLNLVTTVLTNGLVVITLVFLNLKYDFFNFRKFRFDISKYDIIPLILVFSISVISIWRTWYYPPYSYDSMMGIDLIAKYAERDGSISQSQLFTDIVPRARISSNQMFYAPFTMLMQTMNRIIGIPFGQVWLGFLAFSFWSFFYLVSRRIVHPVLAQIGIFLLILAPEYFAYSFILQTDFSNAVYFFIGVYFFHNYCISDQRGHLYLSILGMFLACWSRTETIFFVPFGSLFLLGREYFRPNKKIKVLSFKDPILFTLIPTLSVAIWSLFYVKFYLPSTANLFGQMEFSFDNFFERIGEIISSMNSVVVFNDIYWGYIVSAFIVVLLISIIVGWIKKSFNGIVIVYFIVALYITFVTLTLIFPAVTVQNTFRRGFFKFLPLFSFFIICSPAFLWLNDLLKINPKKRKISPSIKK